MGTKTAHSPFPFGLVFLYYGTTLASHFLFNVADAAGFLCPESASSKELNLDEEIEVQFDTRAICFGTGLWLHDRERYQLSVKKVDDWADGDIETDVGGYHISDLDPIAATRVFIALPLKRSFIRPWFRFIARFGPTGSEESFIDPNPDRPDPNLLSEILRPPADGELFLYVNEAVLPLPWLTDVFYRDHRGSAVVTIKRLR